MLAEISPDPEAADAEYRAAVQVDPSDHLSHYAIASTMLGPVLEESAIENADELDAVVGEARGHLERCMALAPDLVEARLLHAFSYAVGTDDPSSGIASLERYEKAFPARPDIPLYLVRLQLKAGDEVAALDVIDRMEARIPNRVDVTQVRDAVLFACFQSIQRLCQNGAWDAAGELLAQVQKNLEGKEISTAARIGIEDVERALALNERHRERARAAGRSTR
jgi:hypothetical protein